MDLDPPNPFLILPESLVYETLRDALPKAAYGAQPSTYAVTISRWHRVMLHLYSYKLLVV